jgi:hypothetical protein
MRDAQKDVAAVAAVREEFLKNKPPSVPYRDEDKNLIDEAPLFSEDVEFDSDNCTLMAHFGDPPKLVFTKNDPQLIVSVSLPKGTSLYDPQSVQSALLKLYQRVKYYTYSSQV